jgi:hypothetical protein
MRRNFYDELEVRVQSEKASAKLEEELASMEESRPKVESESKSYDSKIWAAYQEVEKAQVCRNVDEITPASDRFNHFLREKLEINDAFFKKREEINGKLSALVAPHKAEATDLVDRQIQKIGSLYVFDTPRQRVNAQGQVTDNVWMVEHKEMEKYGEVKVRYCMISTNAASLAQYRETLVKSKIEIMNCKSLRELRTILENLERELFAISLEPRSTKIYEEDLSKANPNSFLEMAVFDESSQ